MRFSPGRKACSAAGSAWGRGGIVVPTRPTARVNKAVTVLSGSGPGARPARPSAASPRRASAAVGGRDEAGVVDMLDEASEADDSLSESAV